LPLAGTVSVLAFIRWVLRAVVACGLAIDAYVHADLAARYDPISASISQGNLFRIEAGLSALVAALVLLTGRREIYALAVLVAGSALGAIILYRYLNVGKLGPLPNMYEPIWFAERGVAAVAEAIALAGALLGLALPTVRRRASTKEAVPTT
jgi:hypothetical protein